MKLLKWTDEDGFKRLCWVKNDDTSPRYGIPHDPPDFSGVGLTLAQCRELHNHLVENKLITYLDVLNSGAGVTSILRQMKLKRFRQQVLLKYKLDRR